MPAPVGADHVPDFVVRRYAEFMMDGLFLPRGAPMAQLADRLTAVLLDKLRKEPNSDWGVVQALSRIAPDLSAQGKATALATYEEIAGPSGIVTRRNDACAPLFLRLLRPLRAWRARQSGPSRGAGFAGAPCERT